ncbi:MAG: thiamine pyrophosphate-binding protein [Nitrososphaerales archaeon]
MAQTDQIDTVGSYLINKLYANGVPHVFGILGDYVLGFYDQLVKSKLSIINMCDEQGAGFAADAYARLSGLGAVCVTYGVGGLKVVNTTAQAFAEESPVVVISRAPGMKEQEKDQLLHHKVRTFDTQLKVFEQITVACTVLNDPQTASQEIDRVVSTAIKHKRPVYIELPSDMVSAPIIYHKTGPNIEEKSDPNALQEAVREALGMMNNAKNPCILAGAEIQRFGLQDKLLEFVERANIPVATTILAKSVMSGYHPLCMGVYAGAVGREHVRD